MPKKKRKEQPAFVFTLHGLADLLISEKIKEESYEKGFIDGDSHATSTAVKVGKMVQSHAMNTFGPQIQGLQKAISDQQVLEENLKKFATHPYLYTHDRIKEVKVAPTISGMLAMVEGDISMPLNKGKYGTQQVTTGSLVDNDWAEFVLPVGSQKNPAFKGNSPVKLKVYKQYDPQKPGSAQQYITDVLNGKLKLPI